MLIFIQAAACRCLNRGPLSRRSVLTGTGDGKLAVDGHVDHGRAVAARSACSLSALVAAGWSEDDHLSAYTAFLEHPRRGGWLPGVCVAAKFCIVDLISRSHLRNRPNADAFHDPEY